MKDYFLFVNEGDKTYVGSKKATASVQDETLRFSLPKGATELQFARGLMECCAVQTEGAIADTIPVFPGSKDVSYSYRVQHSSGAHTFSKAIYYPTTAFSLLVQDENIAVSSDQLVSRGPLDVEGRRFVHLVGENYAPGTIVVAHLSGLPNANNQGIMSWAAIALILLVCSFAIGYPLVRRRLGRAGSEASPGDSRQGAAST